MQNVLSSFQQFWAKGLPQKLAVIAAGVVIAMCSCCALTVTATALFVGSPPAAQATNTAGTTAPATNTTAVRSTPTVTPTPTQSSTPTPKPTATTQVAHYPPTTYADLRGLAAEGNASAIQTYSNENTGLVGVCPEPRREVLVDPSITGQQLAEDLLAYFYGQGLDTPCGSLVLAYHNASETGGVYTAGRVNLDTADSNGQTVTDPHATNVKYTVTLDIGDAFSGQAYGATYTK